MSSARERLPGMVWRQKEELPGMGRRAFDGFGETFDAWARRIKKRPVQKASHPIDSASELRWSNRQAGRQASVENVRQAGGWLFDHGTNTGHGSPSPCLWISPADRFQGRCAACHLCRHANRHAGRKADCRDCGQAEAALGRRTAAFWMRES